MCLLGALAVPDGPHRLVDLAERARLSRSTAYRLVSMLGEQDFTASYGDGRYAPGNRLSGLAAQILSSFTGGAGGVLGELKKHIGDNAIHLAVRCGIRAVYVQKIDSDKPYEVRSRVGNELWLHCTAVGKAILAHLPPDEVKSVVASAGMPARTPATITDLATLRAELAIVRGRGYAIDDEENDSTVRCLGVVVMDRAGNPRGGMSVSTLTFDVQREELVGYAPFLQAAAGRVADLI